ncbi:hypothetical protein J5751_04960 [bacterium]|nr:hypothetical protein [bacterium]
MKKINKRIQERFNREKEIIELYFKQMTIQQRTSYMFFVCLIQSVYFYLYNRSFLIENIHSYFINHYMKNYNGEISLYWEDMAKSLLKDKANIDLDMIKDGLLDRMSKLYNQDFKTLEQYIEYQLNKKIDDGTFNKICEFIG